MKTPSNEVLGFCAENKISAEVVDKYVEFRDCKGCFLIRTSCEIDRYTLASIMMLAKRRYKQGVNEGRESLKDQLAILLGLARASQGD